MGDVPRLVEDFTGVVEEFPGFGRDLLRFAEDIPDIVGDILSLAVEVRNFVPERLRIWGEIAIGGGRGFVVKSAVVRQRVLVLADGHREPDINRNQRQNDGQL
jgi:hypothetical protein